MRTPDAILQDVQRLNDPTLPSEELEAILDRLAADRAENPAGYDELFVGPEAYEAPAPVFGKRLWKNYVDGYPTWVKDDDWWEPDTLTRIHTRLKKGLEEHGAETLRIKCIGKGHASSDVAAPTQIVMDLGKWVGVSKHSHARANETRTLRAVRSGTRIVDINAALARQGLGLRNMGSFDGQYCAGALCTGTHGSGLHTGPIAESVVSIDLFVLDGAAKRWTFLRVERGDGPTNADAFSAEVAAWPRRLEQDDALFDAMVIAVGCVGVVLSMTLEVAEAFWLTEIRTEEPWWALKARVFEEVEKARESHAHWEFAFLPNPIDGAVRCMVTSRTRAKAHGKPPERERTGDATLFVTKLIGPAFAAITPALLPDTIYRRGFKQLVKPPFSPFTSIAPKVFILGYGEDQPITSCEIHVPLQNAVKAVDRVIELAAKNGWCHTSAVGVRFVGKSRQLLATSNGREICTLEVTLMKGTPKLGAILAGLEADLRETLGARMHWGQRNVLDRDTVKESIGKNWDTWLAVYRRFNHYGTFDNPFTDRLRISRGGKSDA